MTQPAKRPARHEDVVALPENVVGEIVAGELFVSPRPTGPHSVAGSALGGSLIPAFNFGDGGPGDWWILDEPELHFGDDVLVSDCAGWRRARMPTRHEGAFFELPPDWLCEVLSPSTARLDRTRKLPLYARVGIPWVWFVDPIARTLEILRLENQRWAIHASFGGDEVVRAEPFEVIELRLSRLWGEK